MSKQTPGHLAGEMKWLVARYPAPPGKLIFLGSILTNPEEPETSLNRKAGVVNIPEDDKIDESAAVRQKIHSELSANASALLKVVPPVSPLYSAGIKAEGRSSNEVETTVEAMNVSAKIFIPDKPYMDEALERAEITAYVEEGAWSKSLYMIVGVATAGGLAVTEEQSRKMKAAPSANASVAGTGTELAGGSSGETTSKDGSKLETENATDFAYRVREFDYLKFRLSGKFKDKGDWTEGVLFGREAKDDRDFSNDDVVPAFDTWAKEDSEVLGMFVLRT
ncbi:MAG: hypothetical protein M1821_008358 [Bathelium mastoideum]|nr:MAG: hypothetical protein M1821_008358 [Bathelium mastoideum]